MKPSIPFRVRVIRALVNDNMAITLLLGILSFLLAAGFLLSNNAVPNSNYYSVLALAPFDVWAMFFIIYGVMKIHGCLYRTHLYVNVFVSIVGMWSWSYLILSFTIFDPKKIVYPTDILAIFALIIEVWNLSLLLYYYTNPLYKRITDANRQRINYSTDCWGSSSSPISDSYRAAATDKNLEK